MVMVVEDILIVAKIIKILGTMHGTRFEWQTPPALPMVEFIALMEIGWLVVANVIPGMALPMPTLLVSMMLPFELMSTTIFLTSIHSITIVSPTILELELQLLS